MMIIIKVFIGAIILAGLFAISFLIYEYADIVFSVLLIAGITVMGLWVMHDIGDRVCKRFFK